VSSSKVCFSALEEALAGDQAASALKESRAALDALGNRLRVELAIAQPTSRFQRLEAARLAVEAASVVLSRVDLVHAGVGANPFRTGPDQLRKQSS